VAAAQQICVFTAFLLLPMKCLILEKAVIRRFRRLTQINQNIAIYCQLARRV
jgi:hypothetical protein